MPSNEGCFVRLDHAFWDRCFSVPAQRLRLTHRSVSPQALSEPPMARVGQNVHSTCARARAHCLLCSVRLLSV